MPFGALMPILFLSLFVSADFGEIHSEYHDFLISNQLIYEHIFNGYEKDVGPTQTESECTGSIAAREYLEANGNMSNLKVSLELINGSFLQLDQVSQSVYVQLEFSAGNGEWNVVNVSVRDLIIYEGDTENEMQVGEYSIVIKRTTAYYVTIILIPCFLCTLIIVVGLFMAKPAELIGKLSVGLTGIMALVFLMGLAANSLPHTATVPDMTIYILTCLMQIVSSVLYVLLFPNDPFTRAIVSLKFFKQEHKSQP
ncbi:unnamed protein product [Haemonchus placei]|uniref:Neur_chan_LBD domain-containing protein n=1 Tax=Haemonchus placei TaxID=6290 RepID=A0A0N4WM14_HAEPC|nr:unnamed protein product [Haemonchus placei]